MGGVTLIIKDKYLKSTYLLFTSFVHVGGWREISSSRVRRKKQGKRERGGKL